MLVNIYYIRINSILITGNDTVHNLYYRYNLHFLALAYLISEKAVGPLLEKLFNNTKNPKYVVHKAHLTITKKTLFIYSVSQAYYSSSSKQSAIFPVDSSVTYENPLKSRHDICFNYINFRGCYL